MGRIPNSRKYTTSEVSSDLDSNKTTDSQSNANKPLKKRLNKEFEKENLDNNTFGIPIKIVYEFQSNEDLELSMIRHFLVSSHEKYMKIIYDQLDQMQNLLNHDQVYKQNKVSLSDTWNGLLHVVKRNIKTLIMFASDMPVFKDFKEKESYDFVDQNLCTFFLVGNKQIQTN
jgi:hypothetical protein